MTKLKMEIECRTMINGVQEDSRIEKRTVYVRKDGKMYCVVMTRKIPVQKDESGVLYYEWHYRTVAVEAANSVVALLGI